MTPATIEAVADPILKALVQVCVADATGLGRIARETAQAAVSAHLERLKAEGMCVVPRDKLVAVLEDARLDSLASDRLSYVGTAERARIKELADIAGVKESS